MRGGKILVRGNVGYRCGIHMKAYGENKPAIVIGGRAGSFLGEYQAGGTLVVLGLHTDGRPIVGNFCGTGMHGGEIYLRCDKLPSALPAQVRAEKLERFPAGDAEKARARMVRGVRGEDAEKLLASPCWRAVAECGEPV